MAVNDFKDFKLLHVNHMKQMFKEASVLFVADVSGDDMWETYLDSFPPGTNEVFRERREMDCSCCRHFIKSFGNVVAVIDNQITTIWDFDTQSPDKYQPVVDTLAHKVKVAAIRDVFVTKEKMYGTEYSNELLIDSGDVITWNHFSITLPKDLVTSSSKTVPSLQNGYRTTKEVFQRSLEEISWSAIDTILDLISQKSLYRGEEWKSVLGTFRGLLAEYVQADDKDLFCWEKSVEVGPAVTRIRNHSIGTLLTDLTNEMDLDVAVQRYEKIVAPENYKRPKAVFSKRMVEKAKEKLEELGLVDSLPRRFAVLDDITVNNMLFVDRDVRHQIDTGDVFTELMNDATSAVDPKKFDGIREVGIEEFIESILPEASKFQLLLENRHIPSLFSLTTAINKKSPSLFKWDNSFSQAYNGNLADSSMKERVKFAGGKVDNVALRFSLQWNTEGDNNNDYDAHCKEPNGNVIFYGASKSYNTGGELDVDIRWPFTDHRAKDGVAVENIVHSSALKMKPGDYVFGVHNYSHRGGTSGFTAEIEFDGQIFEFDYPHDVRQGEMVEVAVVNLDKEKRFTIKPTLPSTTSAKSVWGVATNQFHSVTLCMLSPNYWDGRGVGNKHHFFVLNNCNNPDQPNGFFNEYLKQEFMEHKRVFEALGSKMKVASSDDQLSGVGFSSTKRNSIICKLEGSETKMVKVNF